MASVVHVVQVVARMNVGGVECWLMDVLKRIDRERFRFTFCTLGGDPGVFDDEIRELGSDIVRCPVDGSRRRFSQRFRSMTDELGADVVHSHLLFFSGVVLEAAAKSGVGIRIAHAHSTNDGHGHGLRRGAYRWLMRRLLQRHCTHGIGCSTQAAEFLFGARWAAQSPCSIMPCGVDPEPFRKTADRAAILGGLKIPSDAFVVGHVGSFRLPKNHAFLLRVFVEVVRLEPRARLLLVGDGALRAEIEASAHTLGITDKVVFAGIRHDVPLLMRHAFDLFLFPSVYEGLGVALVEAQAAGLRCLVSLAVSKEGVMIPSLVAFESLDSSPAVWAQRSVDLLRAAPIDKEAAWRRVAESRFNIDAGVRFLSNLYTGGNEPFGIETP